MPAIFLTIILFLSAFAPAAFAEGAACELSTMREKVRDILDGMATRDVSSQINMFQYYSEFCGFTELQLGLDEGAIEQWQKQNIAQLQIRGLIQPEATVQGPLAKELLCQLSSILKLRDEVAHNYETEDQSENIDVLESRIQACGFKPVQLRLAPGALQSWRHATVEKAFERSENQLAYPEDYQVNADLVQRYQTYAQTLGRDPGKTGAAVKKYVNARLADQLNEKKFCGGDTINHSSEMGPVRNQHNQGWCFAYASADLLSFKMGKRISAADLAYQSFDGFWENMGQFFSNEWSADQHGGYAVDTLTKGLEHGLCLEDQVKSEDFGNSTLWNAIHSIESYKRKSARTDCTEGACTMKCSEQAAGAYFPGLHLKDIQAVIDAASREALFKEMADKACDPREFPNPPLKAVRQPAKDKDIQFATMNKQLEAGNIVEIDYHADILYNKNAKISEAGHASAVIGRRFNETTRSCEYLIRNSWGPDCNQYDKSYECDRGNIWIPKETLWRSINSVTYLE